MHTQTDPHPCAQPVLIAALSDARNLLRHDELGHVVEVLASHAAGESEPMQMRSWAETHVSASISAGSAGDGSAQNVSTSHLRDELRRGRLARELVDTRLGCDDVVDKVPHRERELPVVVLQ